MIRYLLHVSYIGTAFRGVTFIEPFYTYRDVRTVQGVLETAVKNDVEFAVLVVQMLEFMLFTRHFTWMSSTNLKKLQALIRINDVDIVDETNFSAFRNVLDRSYLYRIGIIPKEIQTKHLISIEEISRCFIIESNNFDVEKFKRAAKLFIGKHDYRSFMKYSREDKTKASYYAQRKMYSITIEDSQPCVIAPHLETYNRHYKFFDVRFTANSYGYRQIRRIIGTLCAVAESRITERDVYELLTIPSHKTWDDLKNQKLIDTEPGCALYFIGINYKPNEERSLNDMEVTPRGTRTKSFFE